MKHMAPINKPLTLLAIFYSGGKGGVIIQVQTQSNISLSDKHRLHPVMLVNVISFLSSSMYYIYRIVATAINW